MPPEQSAKPNKHDEITRVRKAWRSTAELGLGDAGVAAGNIDVSLLARIIQRGLAKDGRLVRLQIHLSDRPGSLHQLTRLLTVHQANIVELHHDRTYYGVNLGDTMIDVTLEARGEEQIQQILHALAQEGYRHERIV